jgi:hypothetical protein
MRSKKQEPSRLPLLRLQSRYHTNSETYHTNTMPLVFMFEE